MTSTRHTPRLIQAFAEDALALASWQEELGDAETASQLREWARRQLTQLRRAPAVPA